MMDALFAATLDIELPAYRTQSSRPFSRHPGTWARTSRTPIDSHLTRAAMSHLPRHLPAPCTHTARRSGLDRVRRRLCTSIHQPAGRTSKMFRVAVWCVRRLTVTFRSIKPILRGEIQLTRRAVLPFSARKKRVVMGASKKCHARAKKPRHAKSFVEQLHGRDALLSEIARVGTHHGRRALPHWSDAPRAARCGGSDGH